jgi:hypothetical protein
MPDTTDTIQQQFFERDEDYEALYANNIQFQPSEWDLKVIFGELDFHDDKLAVKQHTSIAMPWLQAKIMHYFLTLQLGVYEMSHGKIKVPSTVLPIEPQPPTGELENDPMAKQIYEYIKKVREQFLESLK